MDPNEILESPYRPYLPDQLITHLEAQDLKDASVEYLLPEIGIKEHSRKKKEIFKTRPTDVRLPARIDSPLIPYPESLKNYIRGDEQVERDSFHSHHTSQLDELERTYKFLVDGEFISPAPQRFDMDSLKRFARQRYSRREGLIMAATAAFAKRATMHDLSIAAKIHVPFSTRPVPTSEYTPFIVMIQRLRIHIAKEKSHVTLKNDTWIPAPDEAEYTMYSNGVYVYHSENSDHNFLIMACGGHFRIFHQKLGYYFCGAISYLDYLFSVSDILNNLDVLAACDEYQWATPLFRIMIEFAEREGHHKQQVDFMKGLEGFILNLSDYDTSFAMNWKPILENSHDLWKLDQIVSDCTYRFELILALIDGQAIHWPRKSFLCKIIVESLKITRTQRQEISALHKLIFYAEVNAEAGVNKFLKRVHTPRAVDPIAVRNMTRHAKQLFLISYFRRHKTLPNIIGPQPKVKLIELYMMKGDHQTIESLPLSWWDEVKIFDCMDNTLTTDPLEFAKDKGALKNKISFGPGDSRKELLQIIERENYELKDFFSTRVIRPLPKSVYRTTQLLEPETIKDPARLIEKEREQKWEARLFANGELENKHSLSLVAAKMKKALSYFDEQLMTPSDRKRKALIHNAARELAFPENYSLLLDIEGHNQSMQHSNTAELCEFVGNLFGYEGWGDLPHYFSQLTVYHYDEYEDNALVSHGQLGGIEGWLNPLWTLHTTLMMKLLRIMTDLELKTIMVYSDDVNAILRIPQASEPMVQSVFQKIMKHCSKFGMTIKYSQTTLSKHRITMLRQHYADGIRADSSLKRLISMSAGNNPMLVSDEVEVAGICSASSSALELSNHNEACAYLKNYKMGLLLVRLPQMILSRPQEGSMISHEELPKKVVNILYNVKQEVSGVILDGTTDLHEGAVNDIANYLGRHPREINQAAMEQALVGVYGVGITEERMVDNADRVLYLQVYDEFLQDLLFFWAYMPTGIGGLGGSLHLNLILSGHSVGFSKSVHYLHNWISNYSSNRLFFFRYMMVCLSVDENIERNMQESRLASSTWPNDSVITPANTSIQQSIKSLVRRITVNRAVHKMFELSDDKERLANVMVNIFRHNFHSRVVQFYHENTSMHFVDLLLNKVETSSGLLVKVRRIDRLRSSMALRAIENIRLSAITSRTCYFPVDESTDIIDSLLLRKMNMFPKVKFVDVEEVLYDDKLIEVDRNAALITIRRCAPTHFLNGVRVFDDPKVGNETLYKGELLDEQRMIGHKEELLAAKLVAITKWFLTKSNTLSLLSEFHEKVDVIMACNLSLSTLTNQRFHELVNFAPTETGGEILHRIPNIRFTTSTYIRAELNRSLRYTSELNQRLMTTMDLVDSNLNVDYVRMRLLVAAIIRDKYGSLRRLVVRYNLSNMIGIKDVQFIAPKITSFTVTELFKSYSEKQEHKLSELRFRYLAQAYLYEENMSDWALMPNLGQAKTAEEMGYNYVTEVIIKYAHELDKDYMLVHPRILKVELWEPLIRKLDTLDQNWHKDNPTDPLMEIRDRLICGLQERGRVSLINPRNKIEREIQKQCLDALYSTKPIDNDLDIISKRYGQLNKSRRHSANLNFQLSKYQAALTTLENHKLKLAIYLLAEYVITFHFKSEIQSGAVSFNVRESLDELVAYGPSAISAMIIAPHLQFQILVLGYEYVKIILENRTAEVRDLLIDISNDISLADIILPTNLPSLPQITNLTGNELIPDYLEEIEYLMTELPESAMLDIKDLGPLSRFAHRCSTNGASPETFTSFTGSDSLGAQIGLFRCLLNEGVIDKEMSVCDLTAGRGDGAYALSHLNITHDSFSRPDTFTRLNYHPKVQFREEYDVFKGTTLKFVTMYEHIHIDLSFPGSSNVNILDLILFLEEQNLQYSIRMNSVELVGYSSETTRDISEYSHYLAYAGNALLKPYQIYLIGLPAGKRRSWAGPTFRGCMAFRAMTTSFSRLLSPGNINLRLENFEPNSVSIQLPQGRDLEELIKSIGDLSVEAERKYYIERYLSEIGPDSTITISMNHLVYPVRAAVQDRLRIFEIQQGAVYTEVGVSDIGNVSRKSRPYHEQHLKVLQDNGSDKQVCKILDCDDTLLELFRVHHPVSYIRSWCNIMIGLRKFCRAEALAGHESLKEAALLLSTDSTMKISLHQREIFLAIKLLTLSASRDNYAFGVSYCRSLIAKSPNNSASMQRTLRIYRLISYIYPLMKYLLSHGFFGIKHLESIRNELEIREPARYKYRRPTEAPALGLESGALADSIIEDSIDRLLQGLEKYSQTLIEVGVDSETPASFAETVRAADMVFDIGIDRQIEAMVARLNLQPTGPRNIIDLGDLDMPDDPDW